MLGSFLELEVRSFRKNNNDLVSLFVRRFRNDFYPFVYPELKLFDPTGFEMVRSVFNVAEREGNIKSFTPSGRVVEGF